MSAVSRDTQDRNKTVCKGTGNGGIKGSANPSPANILIGTLMNASEPPWMDHRTHNAHRRSHLLSSESPLEFQSHARAITPCTHAVSPSAHPDRPWRSFATLMPGKTPSPAACVLTGVSSILTTPQAAGPRETTRRSGRLFMRNEEHDKTRPGTRRASMPLFCLRAER